MLTRPVNIKPSSSNSAHKSITTKHVPSPIPAPQAVSRSLSSVVTHSNTSVTVPNFQSGIRESNRVTTNPNRHCKVNYPKRVDSLRNNNDYFKTQKFHFSSENAIVDNQLETDTVTPQTSVTKASNELPHLLQQAREKNFRLIGTFSGQGFEWFPELKYICTNFPETKSFVENCCNELENFFKQPKNQHYQSNLTYGFRVIDWIENEKLIPDAQYLGSAKVSLPMITLTQVTSILALCQEYNLTPMEFKNLFDGFSGHSQGVITAILLSISPTQEYLLKSTIEILKLTSIIGTHVQQFLPFASCPQRIRNESLELGYGDPTCMLLLQGLTKEEVEKVLVELNRQYPDPSDQLSVSLINSRTNIVVSGAPSTIHNLRLLLDKKHFTDGTNESTAHVLYSERRKVVHCSYVPASIPFHSPLGSTLVPAIEKKVADEKLFLSDDLTIPVFSCIDGSDLRSVKTDLSKYIIEMLVSQPVNWDYTCQIIARDRKPTHMIDFGPGKSSSLLLSNTRGSGIVITEFNTKHSKGDNWFSELNPESMNWVESFYPRLLQKQNSKQIVDTRFARIYKQPPILVAGMTPSTTHAHVVAAATRAGYYAELAGGGLPTPEIFEKEVKLLASLIEPGQSIHVNIIILNAALWNFQFQSCLELRRKGYPIESIVIAAGIPSFEKSKEIISAMQEVGIYRLGFKPGSLSGIEAVIAIAEEHKDMSILVEWTGGRAGGHHSLEDQHDPITRMYPKLREHSNIILVCGGGIGDPEEGWKYLTGEWNPLSPMPFDGILLGSRMMVAKECKTDDRVKELIAKTQGVEDVEKWSLSLTDDGANGIRSIKSELNENLHVIDNKLARLWRDFERDYFIYRDADLERVLKQDRDIIIKRINEDNCKLYFPQTQTGEIVYDITDMTYLDVAVRLLNLSLLNNVEWLEKTFAQRWKHWVQRTIERSNIASLLPPISEINFLETPKEVLKIVSDVLSQRENLQVTPEDKIYFLDLCRRADWKPCNFIPVVDNDLKFWLKKDTLWYSEDFRAVPNNDPERVLVLQGPVAVYNSRKTDETMQDILDSFNNTFVEKLNQNREQLPTSTISYQLPQPIDHLFQNMCNQYPFDWVKGMTASKLLDSNNCWKENPLRSYFLKETNRIVYEKMSEHQGDIYIYDLSYSNEPSVVIKYINSSLQCSIRYDYELHKVKTHAVLNVNYSIQPSTSVFTEDGDFVLVEEDKTLANEKYNNFYSEVWQVQENSLVKSLKDWSWTSPIEKVDSEHITSFLLTANEHLPFWKNSNIENTYYAPLDFAFVVAWPSFAKTVMTSLGVSETMLKGVHLQHKYEVVKNRFWNDERTGEKKWFFCQSGEFFYSTGRVTGCFEKNNGKHVSCAIQLFRVDDQNNNEHIMNISSTCWLPSSDASNTEGLFEETNQSYILQNTNELLSLLMSKKWHNLPIDVQFNSPLKFEIRSITDHKSSVSTSGVIRCSSTNKELAKISYSTDESPKCIVTGFLQRHGLLDSTSNQDFTEDPNEHSEVIGDIVAPRNMKEYSKYSRDVNPLHSNEYIAKLAGFSSPIVHGMFTNSQIRMLVERSYPDWTIESFTTDFQLPVLPSEQLKAFLTKAKKKKNDRIYVNVAAKNSDSFTVAQSKIILAPKYPTAYLFTGQGSAFKGMGMELYNSHTEEGKLAQSIWNSADAFFRENYGVSLLHVIKENPKSLFISWKGKKGKKIRENWLKVFPDSARLAKHDIGFTLVSPNGVLFRTEFQQAAIVVFQQVESARLKHQGFDLSNIVSAGHSVGEFSALRTLLPSIPINNLAEIVFKRGLIMQSVVPRDGSTGSSPYGMVAVNLARTHNHLTLESLEKYISIIVNHNDCLLQIVNWNAHREQYVIAGERVALEVLSVLMHEPENSTTDICKLFDEARAKLESSSGALSSYRSFIPLKDIDIPFHSKIFLEQVDKLRVALTSLFEEHSEISFKPLLDKYIPNITGDKFFSTDLEFIKAVENVTQSQVVQSLAATRGTLPEVLTDQQFESIAKPLLIECLCHQFALPVQWIKTQELLVRNNKLSKFTEIGPTATLVPLLRRVYLRDEIMKHSHPFGYPYQLKWSSDESKPEPKQPKTQGKGQTASPVSPTPAPAPVPTQPAPQPVVSRAPIAKSTSKKSVGSSTSLTLEFNSLHLLKVLLSHKLKNPIEKIQSDKTIRELVGGRSALQNEIMADIQKEFIINGEGLEQLPIQGVAEKIKINSNTPFNSVVDAILSRVLPSGFNRSSLVNYWTQEWGAASSSTHVLLCHASTPGVCPSESLADEGSLFKWLDNVVLDYCKSNSLPVPSKRSDASGGDQGQALSVAAIDPKQFESLMKLFEKQRDAISQFIADSTSMDESEKENFVVSDIQLESIIKEHGTHYLKGIQPQFDAFKIRGYDSWLHWGKLQLVQFLLNHRENVPSFPVLEPGQSHDSVDWTRFLRDSRSLELKRSLYTLANRSSPQLYQLLLGQMKKIRVPHDFATFVKSAIDSKLSSPAKFIEHNIPMEPVLLGDGSFSESPRYHYLDDISYVSYVKDFTNPQNPYRFHVSRALSTHNDPHNNEINQTYADSLEEMVTKGVSFNGVTALLVGAGPGSIASFVARNLLQGGAHVIIANAYINTKMYNFFQNLYQTYGSKDSRLDIVPLNAVSKQDIKDLVQTLWKPKSQGGLGCGAPDFIIPFAALPEQATTVSHLDDQSELAHRAMLTNIHRLVGLIGDKVATEHKPGKVCLGASHVQVILPLSPNHGIFGYDGLYAESKLGLRALFMKCKSEPWGEHVNVVGTEIGWTRSTNLMGSHDSVSYSIETKLNMKTFNQTDMALNLTAFMHPNMVDLTTEFGPFVANLTGGFKTIDGQVCEIPLSKIRQEATLSENLKREIEKDNAHDQIVKQQTLPTKFINRAKLHKQFEFPRLPDTHKPNILEGLVDLSQVVVVVGYGEVGPYGNHRTRWEWEKFNKFSKEGALELARAMGLIEFQRPSMLGRNQYIGWVDSKTKKPVEDDQIWETYGDIFVSHCGIRFIDPLDTPPSYDPKNKLSLKQVSVEEDLPPFEITSKEDELQLKQKYGDLVEIFEQNRQVMARLKKGASIYVSKLRAFDRQVGAMLPKGWDPVLAYGIPDEIVKSIDPVSVYSICATMDALIMAGIRDPYELYNFVHPAEVGTALGSGMGGAASIRKSFRDRLTGEQSVESDVLQETFINTPAAWVNMLLMSSAGPIKPQVAACATAASSIDSAVDCILRGKAKVMLAGGVETFSEEGSYEFGMMNATSSSDYEQKIGYTDPKQMCRPCSTSRSGFMEGKGCGVQILMSADVALQMGCPIYGIVGLTATASDKQGRSVPAPGQGLLSTYRDLSQSNAFVPPPSSPVPMYDLSTNEEKQDLSNPLLSVEYRRKQFDKISSILPIADRDIQLKQAQQLWGHNFYINHPAISPMRGALSVWGLSADDIDVVSFHGTGTKANDSNESNMIHRALAHIGRSEGNPVYSIFQKSFTGHSKGAAAAWMFNGLLQSINEGVVPANRNLDNVDSVLDPYSNVLFANQNIYSTEPFKAGIVQSFGFGQAGSSILVIHPNYLYGAINSDAFANYGSRRADRYKSSLSHWLSHVYGERPLMKLKNKTQYPEKEFQSVMLNSMARSNHWNLFANQHLNSLDKNAKLGFGIDVEQHTTFQDFNMKENFLSKNFTGSELSHARSSIRPIPTFTGKWCAKEAVVKAFCSLSNDSVLFDVGKDQSAALIDIEVVSEGLNPTIQLHGKMKELASHLGISESDIHISISHTDTFSCAQCIIRRN